MAKQIGVQAGQQYVKVDSTRNPPPVWEVMSIYSGVGRIVHAGLMNPEARMDRKTLSISALLDEKRYRLLRDVGADPVEQDTSRGAMKTKAEPMLPSSKPASVFSGLPASICAISSISLMTLRKWFPAAFRVYPLPALVYQWLTAGCGGALEFTLDRTRKRVVLALGGVLESLGEGRRLDWWHADSQRLGGSAAPSRE